MSDPRLALAKAAGAAWDRYRSTVLMGGTPKQRRWAFTLAVKAEDKLAVAERVEEVARKARNRRAAA